MDAFEAADLEDVLVRQPEALVQKGDLPVGDRLGLVPFPAPSRVAEPPAPGVDRERVPGKGPVQFLELRIAQPIEERNGVGGGWKPGQREGGGRRASDGGADFPEGGTDQGEQTGIISGPRLIN
jgi:hypothetical protein